MSAIRSMSALGLRMQHHVDSGKIPRLESRAPRDMAGGCLLAAAWHLSPPRAEGWSLTDGTDHVEIRSSSDQPLRLTCADFFYHPEFGRRDDLQRIPCCLDRGRRADVTTTVAILRTPGGG